MSKRVQKLISAILAFTMVLSLYGNIRAYALEPDAAVQISAGSNEQEAEPLQTPTESSEGSTEQASAVEPDAQPEEKGNPEDVTEEKSKEKQPDAPAPAEPVNNADAVEQTASDKHDEPADSEPGKADETNQAEDKAEDEAGAKNEQPENIEYPAFSQEETVDGVMVHVCAPEGVFPEGAGLSVAKAEKSDQKAVDQAVKEARAESANVAVSYTFDIKVLDTDGNELQPKDGQAVKVTFETAEAADKNLTADVYHICKEDNGELTAEPLETEEKGETVTAETDGFSFYTVEFTYESKQYVMQGNTTVTLADILKEVGLEGDAEDVTVSNEDLFSASKKDGEWVVTAHQAFTSEEWMKVVIDGVEYEIVVTDTTGTVVQSGTVETTKWELYSDGTLVLSPSSGSSGNMCWFMYPPWRSYSEQIKRVEVSGTIYLGKSSSSWLSGSITGMFQGCTNLISIDMSHFDTSNVTNMRSMFYNCSKLTSLDVSGFNTNNVTNMGWMFYGCSSLTSLDVSKFKTSNVTDMQGMFQKCSSLILLDVSGFNTGNVTNMSSMFKDCSSLTSLNVSGFDTSKVTDMNSMFYNCSKLTSLDVSRFNTSNVKTMSFMFSGCSKLSSLDVSRFNTSNVTNMSSMFYNCSKLTSLDVSRFNTSNVTNMDWMFTNCSGLTSLDISGFKTSKVTNMSSMFSGCSKIVLLDVSNLDTCNVTNMDWMFNNCSGLTSLDVSAFNTSNVKSMSFMFSGCSNLTTLNVSMWNTSNVTNMGSVFSRCSKLSSLNLSNWDTSNVTETSFMFWDCSGLTSLDLSKFDTSKITDMNTMFSGCSGLNSLTVPGNFVPKSVTGSKTPTLPKQLTCTLCADGTMEVINESTKLPNITVTTTYVTEPAMAKIIIDTATDGKPIYAKYDDTTNTLTFFQDDTVASNLIGRTVSEKIQAHSDSVVKVVFAINEGTKIILNVSGGNGLYFSNCTKLTSIVGIKTLDTSHMDTMSSMFKGCAGLTSLDVSSFSTENVVDMSNMFYNCSKLSSLDVSGFDISNSVDMTKMFYGCSNLSSITLGDDFLFKQAILPTPPSATTTGKWVLSADHSKALTPKDLQDNYPNADTAPVGKWVWQINPTLGTAYAVLTAEGELIFFRSTKTYTAGTGKTVTDIAGNTYTGQVYTGIETYSGTSSNSAPWYNQRKSIKSARVAGGQLIQPISCAGWFYDCSNMTSCSLTGLDTSNVLDMRYMFDYCSGLTTLDVSRFDTSNVTSMGWMFSNCSGLTTLDVSNFNTSNVTNMYGMFSSCFKLTTLDVSNFNTSNVTNMGYMFSSCSGLTTLDVSGWNTGNVTNMGYMFQGCSGLTTLDVSNFNTSNVTSMAYMFYSCSSLSSINLGSNFSFKGKNIASTSSQAVLPTPPSATTTGKWMLSADHSKALTPTALRDSYPNASTAPVGEWVWQSKYTVTFNANGKGTAPAAQTVEGDQTPVVQPTVEPVTVSGTKYIVSGWYREPACTNQWNFADPVTSDMTLYAKWEALVDLSVKTVVSGNMGNRTDTFQFTLTLAGERAPATVEYALNNGARQTATLAGGKYQFSLGHDDTITFYDLREGVQYNVTETHTHYATTVSVNSGTAQSSRTANGTLAGNTSIVFTNARDMAVPTTADTSEHWAFAIVGLIPAMAGVLIVSRKRKKR